MQNPPQVRIERLSDPVFIRDRTDFVKRLNDQLTASPFSTEALLEYSSLLRKAGHASMSTRFAKQAQAVIANDEGDWLKLGRCLYDGGEYVDAWAAFYRTVRLNTCAGEGHVGLARVCLKWKEYDLALAHLEEASTFIEPNGEFCVVTAKALRACRRCDEAKAWAERAFLLNNDLESVVEFAHCLAENGAFDRSTDVLRQFVEQFPDIPEAYAGLSLMYLRRGLPAEASAVSIPALRAFPGNSELQFHAAWSELMVGNWESGWRYYESRWGLVANSYRDRFPTGQPPFAEWSGNRGTKGGTILVTGEQGAGDVFMFSKTVPQLRKWFDRVVLLLDPSLCALYECLSIGDEVRSIRNPIPRHEEHISIGSIPYRLGWKTIADAVEIRAKVFRPEIPYHPLPSGDRPRVGFVWSGNDLGPNDSRGLSDEAAAILVQDQRFLWVVLQKGFASISPVKGACANVVSCGPWIADWLDTATILMQLDALVAVDTGVAHLGGLLGMKTITVLPPTSADWRWLDPLVFPEWEDNAIWYENMTLIRRREGLSSQQLAQMIGEALLA